MIYVVTNKLTGQEVHRYTSDAQIEWSGMELDTHMHTVLIETPESQPLAPSTRRLSKLAFIDRLGDDAYEAILSLARSELTVEAFVKRFEMTTPDADGTSVDLADPRTIQGVTLIGAALFASGVVSENWAQEVLNGN